MRSTSAKAPTRELFEQQYSAALKDYLDGGRELALRRAWDVARQAVPQGLGAREILEAHHSALATLLGLGAESSVIDRAGEFLVLCLAPPGVTLRGLQESRALVPAGEEHYRSLFERSVAGMFRSTSDGRILACNEAFARMLGCASRGEVMTHRAWDFYFDRRHRQAKLDQLRKHKALTNFEVCLRRKDGTPLWALVNEYLLDDEKGECEVLEGTLIDISERKRAEEALRGLNQALEEQANRIARELHDEAGQLVASIYVALRAISRDVSEPVRRRLRSVMRLLDQIEVQQRRLCHELRPTVLDNLGLVRALDLLAKSISARTGISVSVESSANGRLRLPSSIEMALYRVVQEGLNNAAKHARAARVTVRLRREVNAVQCSIEDDGIGFDVSSVLTKRARRGLGFLGMWQRVDALRGSLTVNSKPGGGTQLAITIPVGGEECERQSSSQMITQLSAKACARYWSERDSRLSGKR